MKGNKIMQSQAIIMTPTVLTQWQADELASWEEAGKPNAGHVFNLLTRYKTQVRFETLDEAQQLYTSADNFARFGQDRQPYRAALARIAEKVRAAIDAEAASVVAEEEVAPEPIDEPPPPEFQEIQPPETSDEVAEEEAPSQDEVPASVTLPQAEDNRNVRKGHPHKCPAHRGLNGTAAVWYHYDNKCNRFPTKLCPDCEAKDPVKVSADETGISARQARVAKAVRPTAATDRPRKATGNAAKRRRNAYVCAYAYKRRGDEWFRPALEIATEDGRRKNRIVGAACATADAAREIARRVKDEYLKTGALPEPSAAKIA